jgi:uncharacterized protein (TIGR03118 family)
MRTTSLRRGTALTLGLAATMFSVAAGPASAEKHGQHGDSHGRGAYSASVLVADDPAVGAPITDPHLINPWGITFGPTTPLWVANNGTSTSTLYRTDTGPTQVPLVVSTQPAPTGVVFNPTNEFALPNGTATRFLFDSLSGQISGWPSPSTQTTTTVVTIPGAVYTGLALAQTRDGARLFAADAAAKVVHVFDGRWDLVGVLRDPRLPKELTPYNVAVLGGKVYVSYAPPPDAEATARIHGAVDVYGLDGRLHRRLITGGPLNGPWGMALAPKGWGRFGGALLVGNEDGGRINAFNPRSGHFLGTLRDVHGQPIGEDGLWGIAFGNGVIGTPEQLVIAIGPDDYQHGLVELVSPVKKKHD